MGGGDKVDEGGGGVVLLLLVVVVVWKEERNGMSNLENRDLYVGGNAREKRDLHAARQRHIEHSNFRSALVFRTYYLNYV